MKAILIARIPHEKFNAAVRDGSVGPKLNKILEETRPQTVHFTEFGGRRAAVMLIELDDASKIPVYAEPWFLTFDAEVEFHPTMTPDDLKRAGLEALGKKWA